MPSPAQAQAQARTQIQPMLEGEFSSSHVLFQADQEWKMEVVEGEVEEESAMIFS